jgi:hypothetical protein
LLVRPSGFAPDYRCYYGQDFRHQSVHASSHPRFRPTGAPTYAIRLLHLWLGLSGGLESRSFWAPRTSAGKLLRYSWRVAASKLTSRLSRARDHLQRITLSPHLGTLTRRWVVSLTVHRLTPRTGLPASAASVGSEFDRRADLSRGRSHQSVSLPHGLRQRRSCFDMFRSEPAVAGLDGPFTPTRRSREGIVKHQP